MSLRMNLYVLVKVHTAAAIFRHYKSFSDDCKRVNKTTPEFDKKVVIYEH